MTNDKAEILLNYLIDGRKNGIDNFTVSFQSDTHFIVHPESVDGETIDIHLDDITWESSKFPFGSTGQSKEMCDHKLQIASDRIQKVSIMIDGYHYMVYPIVTYGQLKIMAGCNNSGYKVVCENPPEHWNGKEPCQTESIDLNMPHHGLYTFKIIRKNGTE